MHRSSDKRPLAPDLACRMALPLIGTGQNVFLTDGNEILRFVASASTLVPGTPISGSNTGLNLPLALTVGAP
jgi:hypothetical protein